MARILSLIKNPFLKKKSYLNCLKKSDYIMFLIENLFNIAIFSDVQKKTLHQYLTQDCF